MKLPSLQSLFGLDFAGSELNQQLHDRAKDAVGKKDLYLGEMAKATTQDDIFKHFLLANMSSIESYVTTARLQSQSSFALCKKVAYLAFALIALGVALGLWAWFKGKDLELAQMTGLAGVLTQFISGVFFYLYNRTLEQMNRFSDKLASTQELAICFVANSNIDDEGKRDDSTAALAKLLLSRQLPANGTPSPETSQPATSQAGK